ncbi:MAG TPA: hypothetical protein VGF94_04295 [Kofleriaceae bacterium]|jgi:hypothetical protein
MRAIVATITAAVALAACSSSPGKPIPLALEVATPARGATTTGGSVTVTGTASGDAVVVTVLGNAVAVGKDGSFSTTATVPPGISVIETDAIDRSGDKLVDVRAVLAGELAASDGSVDSAIGAHASAAALATIGDAVAVDAKSIDYTAVAKALNPIYDNGGCLGAVVNIDDVSIGDVAVSLAPSSGALATEVTLEHVSVKLGVSFKVACIGGSDTITVSASAAHVSGDLGLHVTSGKLATSLSSPAVTLSGFELAVGGVPSEVVDLFRGTIQTKVQSALANAIASKVPGIANAKLAALLAAPFDGKLLGFATKISITPTTATISDSGLFVAATTKVSVTGGDGGMFVTDPMPLTSSLLASTTDLGVAVANDLVNQLFAGLWAAGAFDATIPVSSLSVLAALLDPDAANLKVSLALPPTVSTDASGNLQLAVGDALIVVQDAGGNPLQQIALSLTTTVSAAPVNGSISLALGAPTVFAQVLAQADDGSRELTDAQVQGIVTGAWSIVGQQASTALAKLPMPSLGGVHLGAPVVAAQPGFIVADVALQ